MSVTNRFNLPFDIRLTLLVLRVVFRGIFGLEVKGFEKLNLLKGSRTGPVVVSNHLANLDPLFLVAALNERIKFLASDLLFRRPVLSRLLRWAGMIPKRKFHADPGAVRSLKEAVAKGDWVGFFPEGEATWAGPTRPPILGTGKLLKFLRTPVIILRIHGAYFSQGRWAYPKHRGKIEIEVVDVITLEELKGSSGQEIEQRVTQGIYIDPWTDPQDIKLNPPHLSGMESTLVYCPVCQARKSLKAARFRISCKNCGSTAVLTRDYRLNWQVGTEALKSPKKKEALPGSIPEWSNAQDRWFAQTGPQVFSDMVWDCFFEEHNPRKGKCYSLAAQLTGSPEGAIKITISAGSSRAEQVKTFPLAEISGINVQMEERLEFRHKGRLYIIRFHRPFGGYPWYRAFGIWFQPTKREAAQTADGR